MREFPLDGTWQLIPIPRTRRPAPRRREQPETPSGLSFAIDFGSSYEPERWPSTREAPFIDEHLALDPDLERTAIEARVPGSVELDLVRAGLLADPFVGRSILELAQYEHHAWIYRRTFVTPNEAEGCTVMLLLEGVDCFSRIDLNGNRVGSTANMLIPHSFDVTAWLHPPGESNELVVHIQPAVPVAAARPPDASVAALPCNLESARVRKAAHMYGWDIAPRAVSAGLWRSVKLQFLDPLTVGDLYYVTRHADERQAVLGVHWHLRFAEPARPRVSQWITDFPEAIRDPQLSVQETADWRGCELRFAGACGESRFERTIPCRFAAGVADIPIGNPRLWWPKGYGEPALYEVTCQLLRDGKVLDERKDRIGIRTLELVRTDTTTRQQPGEFLFKVNATPILVKGSNWVPADAFHSRDAERVPKILALFDDLGCNMIRCWGGGVYEDHPFFDFCDAHGILVWQDFAMACGRYPQDEEFLAAMRTEAESIVRKLRNHPSLALWAGDNECDEAHLWWGRLDPNQNRITREVLPQVVRRCDPWRPYLPSSPYIAPAVFAAGDGSLMPEQHLWGPRDYYKSRFYTETTAHFASEIGYHGCPAIDSLKEFLSPDKLWPWQGNDEWRIHAADTWPEPGPYAYRIELMAKQIREVFGIEPDNLQDFVLASQICQAEAKKFFVEMVRLKKWRMTGLIWWNVMDCWPQFSDAIVDYYFRRKLAYLYLKRVQRPACILVGEPENWVCRVVLGNDSREAVRGRFTIRDADTDAILLEGAAEAGPNENCPLGSVPASRGQQKLFLIDWELNGEKGLNHYLLGTPPFELERYRAWLAKLAPMAEETLIREGL